MDPAGKRQQAEKRLRRFGERAVAIKPRQRRVRAMQGELRLDPRDFGPRGFGVPRFTAPYLLVALFALCVFVVFFVVVVVVFYLL